MYTYTFGSQRVQLYQDRAQYNKLGNAGVGLVSCEKALGVVLGV